MNNLFNNRNTYTTTTTFINNSEAFRAVINGDLSRLRKDVTSNNVNNFVDVKGNNLLHSAVMVEEVEIIKFLLLNKININKNNFSGKSPWDMAMRTQNRNIIQLFTDHENPHIESNRVLTVENINLRDRVETAKTENVILRRNNLHLREENDVLQSDNKNLKLSVKNLREENEVLQTDNKKLKLSVKNLTDALRK